MINFDFNLNQARWPFYEGLPLLMAFVAGFALWMVVLVRVLTRRDLDPVTRLTWVIVVVALNILGAVLYVVINPFMPRPLPDGSGDSLAKQTERDYRTFLRTDPEAARLSSDERLERFTKWRMAQDT